MKTLACIFWPDEIDQKPDPEELMDALRRCVLLLAVLSIAFAAQSGAAPANDNFANAIQLTGLNITTTGSNVGATKEPDEISYFGSSNSVWWKWSVPVPYTVMEVNTIGSSFDTVLLIYDSWYPDFPSVGNLRLRFSDDQSGGNNTSKLTFQATQTDTTNYIAVDGYLGETGNLTLRLLPIPPPANDNFTNAFLITGLTNSVTGHNTNATGEVGEPEHGYNPIPRSVWWRWVAPTNWVVRMDTFGSYQSFSPSLSVYQGNTVSNLTRLAEADRYERLTFRPQTGQTYRFAVDGWYGNVGQIVLNLQASPPPTNDAFAAAALITGYTNTITGDNTFATQEASEPLHSGSDAGKSLWYRWTAPTNWAVAIESEGSAISTAVAVYRGSSVNALTVVATQSFGEITFTATRNQTYYIAVDSSSASSQSGAFTLNLRTLRPPTNDNFSAAATLTGASLQTQGILLGGRTETNEPPHGDKSSVWYRWTAPRTGRVRITCYEQVIAYFGSQLNALTKVSRSTSSTWEHVFDAISGTQYYFAVTGSQADEAPFTLDLIYGPANDDFAAAISLSGIADTVQGSTVGASMENGEPEPEFMLAGNSVWWKFSPPADGYVEIEMPGIEPWPALWIYEGSSLSNLVLRASNRVPDTAFNVRCKMSCDVKAGQIYYLCASSAETNFTFNLTFRYAPPNDSFAGRMTIEPSATVAFGSTVGASREPGEPWVGSNSVWWSWTPPYAGPVILSTYGSACDTMLGVYSGTSVSALSQVAANDDCLVWTNGHPAAGWTTAGGPTNDVISRVRFNADNGVPYRIAVSVAPTDPKPGQVAVNITRLAIEDVVVPIRTSNANRTVSFTANLRLVNLQTNNSGRLRVRLVARPGYSFRERNRFNCFAENFTAGETNLGTFGLPGPGTILARGTNQFTVSGVCPPPHEGPSSASGPEWGCGFGVIGVLEEQQGSAEWLQRDARMILIGEWPAVGPFQGPGGGVILVSASLSGGNEVGFLDVKIGPPAAVALNGAWRVSPSNYGEMGELRPYTNYTSSNLRLAIRSTNFSIQTRPLNGFVSPPNQTVTIQPSDVVPLNLNYSVVPPRLTFDRVRGLGISGTPQTTYRIQHVTNYPATTWPAYTNITLIPGTNWMPQTTNYFSNRFYRAFWLSN